MCKSWRLSHIFSHISKINFFRSAKQQKASLLLTGQPHSLSNVSLQRLPSLLFTISTIIYVNNIILLHFILSIHIITSSMQNKTTLCLNAKHNYCLGWIIDFGVKSSPRHYLLCSLYSTVSSIRRLQCNSSSLWLWVVHAYKYWLHPADLRNNIYKTESNFKLILIKQLLDWENCWCVAYRLAHTESQMSEQVKSVTFGTAQLSIWLLAMSAFLFPKDVCVHVCVRVAGLRAFCLSCVCICWFHMMCPYVCDRILIPEGEFSEVEGQGHITEQHLQ